MGVTSGRIIAGPHVRDACARHLRDLKDGPKRGLKWCPDLADWIIRFFPTVLRLNGGADEGLPFNLHESQQFIVGSLFGWTYRATRTRRFQAAFIEEGKGSGKSPTVAGIGLYMLVADKQPRAEVYAAAVDKDQAGILFRDAVAMVRQSPALARRITFSGGRGREYNMADLATGSFFRPISSESSGRGKSGFRPHCVLLDEVHEHPTGAMVEFLTAGIKKDPQALVLMITNSGVDRASICYEYHQYGAKVAAGDLQDDTFFSYICACDEGDDPFTDEPDAVLGYPACWAKTNPLLGVTIQPSYLEKQVREARGMPSKESLVRRLNFCEWVDAENPWIDGDLWRACEVEALELPPAGGFIGLDLSGKRDLTAAARVVRAEDGVLEAEVRFWTPADTLSERAAKDRVPYEAWVRDGRLIAVPGRSIDYGFVVNDIAAWLQDDVSLAFDPYRMEDFQRALDAAGIDSWIYEGADKATGQGVRLVRHLQGFGGGTSESSLWMPRSIGELETVVLNGTLRVRKNPVLTWASASAVLMSDSQANKKWEKRKSTGRIDGIVALAMAIGGAAAMVMDQPEPSISFI